MRIAAFHSAASFSASRGPITLHAVEIPAVSGLTGAAADQIAALTPGYRVRLVTRELPRAAGGVNGAPQLGGPTTVTDVAKLALSLEMAAAATYTFATANVYLQCESNLAAVGFGEDAGSTAEPFK